MGEDMAKQKLRNCPDCGSSFGYFSKNYTHTCITTPEMKGCPGCNGKAMIVLLEDHAVKIECSGTCLFMVVSRYGRNHAIEEWNKRYDNE
jgi:hypothetical protein